MVLRTTVPFCVIHWCSPVDRKLICGSLFGFYEPQRCVLLTDERQSRLFRRLAPACRRSKELECDARSEDNGGQSLSSPASHIRANKYDLSLNRYKETKYEEASYDPPKVILSRMRELEKEILKDIDELEGMLE